ncbi:MAG TPA: hypothetical protein PLP99_02445 [Ignavibacteriales bacterium]|nr:hypothetical protein [Ignavibacteriales bacterium]HOL80601.1 hypothetical protein [Ignavibacteriales bacterium]HOM64289.1 hypothetical protein [Ignavibacteriales bacterium]HPP33065.1 hypothetical protein [Ignavibacteriales bacterium]HRR18293.1 hypothetical protein [Ignavibacteriales bacterium]
MYKALVLLYSFPPFHLNSSLRTFNYLRNFKNSNWEISLITSTPFDVELDSTEFLKHGIRISELTVIPNKHKNLNNFTTFKANFQHFVNTLFYIPDTVSSWAKKAAKKVDDMFKYNNYDVLYISVPPFSLFNEFAYLKKKYDIPLIVDYFENWSDNYNNLTPTIFHKSLHKKYEYNSLKIVDKIIVPNRKMKEHLLNKYPFLTFDDILILSNSYFDKDFIHLAPIESSKLKILHPGSVFSKFDYFPFLQAVSEIASNNLSFANHLEIHFATPLRSNIKKKIQNLNITSLIYEHNLNSLEEFNQLVVNSDIIFISMPDIKGIDLLTPPLVYHLFGSKKPFLAAIPDGVLKNDLEKYNACYFAEIDNIPSIKKELLQIYEDYKNKKLAKVNYEFLHQFDASIITEELIKLFHFYLPYL